MKDDSPNEGQICFNANEPEKIKIFKNGNWEEFDPFQDLEERKVKK